MSSDLTRWNLTSTGLCWGTAPNYWLWWRATFKIINLLINVFTMAGWLFVFDKADWPDNQWLMTLSCFKCCCSSKIAFLVSRRSLYSQVFGMKKPLVKTFEGVYIEQEPKDDLCWKKCLSSLYRAHHVHPALAKQKKLNPTRFTGRQIKVQYVCVVFNHVP